MKILKNKLRRYYKIIFANRFTQTVCAFFIAMILKLVFLTCKIEIQTTEANKKYIASPFIGCIWHGRSLGGLLILQKFKIHGEVISSKHRDGQLMSKIVRYFNLKTINGSSTSGSVAVLRNGIASLDKHKNLFITPDGPNGPRMRLKEGALYFAKMSQLPLIPICFSQNNGYVSKYWDRFFIIKPFHKIIINIGNPFFISKDTTNSNLEKYRIKFENLMINQQTKLDKLCNIKKIEPENYRTIKRRSF